MISTIHIPEQCQSNLNWPDMDNYRNLWLLHFRLHLKTLQILDKLSLWYTTSMASHAHKKVNTDEFWQCLSQNYVYEISILYSAVPCTDENLQARVMSLDRRTCIQTDKWTDLQHCNHCTEAKTMCRWQRPRGHCWYPGSIGQRFNNISLFGLSAFNLNWSCVFFFSTWVLFTTFC